MGNILWVYPVGNILWVYPVGNMLWMYPVGNILWVYPVGNILRVYPVGLYTVDDKLVFCCPQDIDCCPHDTAHPQDMLSTYRICFFTHRICTHRM